MTLLVVVGMRSEAALVRPPARAAIGAAGLADALAGDPAGTRALVSFGLCGALDPALKVGELVLAEAVVAAGWRIETDPDLRGALRAALPGARGGDVAGADAILGDRAAKAALREAAAAAAVDMESHAVALAAREAGLPFAVLRAVSDDARRTLPLAAQAGFRPDGTSDLGAVIAGLVRRPWELPGLVRTGLEASVALAALRRAAPALQTLASGF
jgi:hopanoid-associated phosphorylase